MYKGWAFDKNNMMTFTSEGDYHDLDGRKFNGFHLRAIMDSPEEIQELIDWLKITKLGMT